VPDLPLRGWILIGALVTFSVVILSVLYWAQFTGRAGTQRGLVIHNDLQQTIEVRLADLPAREIEGGNEVTFVIKRDQFPTEIQVQLGRSSSTVESIISELDYRYVADAEFRLSIDEQGIHPTATYRDTPVPATETP
jgi:hypothetical protein